MSDTARRRFPDDYGPVLYLRDMAEIWGISEKRAYALHAEGAFDFARNRPTVGRISFSRDRVQAYLAGDVEALRVVHRRKAG